MLDLASFDDVADRVMTLAAPGGMVITDEAGNPITVSFYGPDSPQYGLARNKMMNELRRLQARATAANPVTVQDEKAIYIQFYADITKGWSAPLPIRGKPVEFSTKNAADVYRTVNNLYRSVNAFLLTATATSADQDFSARSE
jgi:hypothetical protein